MKKLLFLSLISILVSCSDDDNNTEPKSTEKQINEFAIDEHKATIDQSNKTITLELAYGTDVSSLKPLITVSEKASVNPASGAEQNFTNPVKYTVTAEDESQQTYTVTILKAKSSDKDILSFYIPMGNKNIVGKIDHQTKIISMVVPAGTDIKKLTPIIAISQEASIDPPSEAEQDFTNPVIYTTTAPDGSQEKYTAVVKDEIDNAAPRLVSTIIDRESGIKPYHRFTYDNSKRLIRYVETEPEYLDEEVEKDEIEIVYSNNGKVTTITKKENTETTSILNITYKDNHIIHVTDASSATDIISLDDKGLVTQLEKDGIIQKFEYDKDGNLIKLIAADGSYQTIDYDDKNGIFRYGNTPQWIWLYATGELIGKGTNNFIASKTYTPAGELKETINYRYTYEPNAWYPNAYKKENNRTWVCMFYISM